MKIKEYGSIPIPSIMFASWSRHTQIGDRYLVATARNNALAGTFVYKTWPRNPASESDGHEPRSADPIEEIRLSKTLTCRALQEAHERVVTRYTKQAHEDEISEFHSATAMSLKAACDSAKAPDTLGRHIQMARDEADELRESIQQASDTLEVLEKTVRIEEAKRNASNLTLAEAAKLIGCGAWAVIRLMERGDLEPVAVDFRTTGVTLKSVLKYIKEGK